MIKIFSWFSNKISEYPNFVGVENCFVENYISWKFEWISAHSLSLTFEDVIYSWRQGRRGVVAVGSICMEKCTWQGLERKVTLCMDRVKGMMCNFLYKEVIIGTGFPFVGKIASISIPLRIPIPFPFPRQFPWPFPLV